jgi:serine/threonine-protein kinase
VATPPARIDKYELIRRLGHGGMGTVYLARDPDLDRLVAIKVLRDPLFDEELLERFLREARAAAKLRHANLITIYDVGQHDHQPFMAMEYVDGTTLASVIAERQPLRLAEKLSYIEQICAGLHHAHCEGIIHRDVKPANLMLDRHRVVRILDFGIARIEGSGMTQEGAMMGTLSYMAPEQMLGRAVDYRSDIYGVGAVAYELLAYQKAFNLEAALRPRQPGDTPLPLSECCPGLSPGLEEIVMRSLASRPEERFADLEEARAAFRDVRRRIDPELQLETMPPRSRSRAPGGALTPSGSAPATILLPRHTPRGLDAGFEPTLQRTPAPSATATPAVVRAAAPLPAPSPWPRIALAAAGMALLGTIVMGVSWWRAGDETPPASATPAESRASTPVSPRVSAGVASPAGPVAPAETPPTVPSPGAAGAALQARLDGITAAYRSGDLTAALEQIAPTLATSDDERVRRLAKTIATSAYQLMTGAARAAGAQNASTLSPGPFGAGERSRKLAEEALRRTDYVGVGTYALAAAGSYRRAETEALAAVAATAAAPQPAIVPTASVPPPVSAPVAASAPPSPAPAPVAAPPAAAAVTAPVTPPVAAAAAPVALDAERSGIMRALTRYQEAYRERSVKLLRDVYPSLPRETGQRLDRSFNDCRAYEVSFLNPQVALAPDDPTSATVNVRSTYTCQPRSRQPAQPASVQDVFLLRKLGDAWLIENAGVMDTGRR